MTTPPTTAGWYPDPDGSGGQRYWDGAAWTDHGPDATDTPGATEETSAWPAELPPWPEDMTMPSWEEAGKAEPVSEVETPEADVALEPEAAEEPRRGSTSRTSLEVATRRLPKSRTRQRTSRPLSSNSSIRTSPPPS